MANRDYTIAAPDGREITISGPDNATPDQLRQAAQRAFSMMGTPKPERSVAQMAGDVGAGLVRGAGSIGATLLAPIDYIRDKIDPQQNLSGLITGEKPLSRNAQRRKDMTSALGMMGADTEGIPFKAGQIGGEVAGTLGVGGALAPAVARVAPSLASAVASGGFQGGNLATRAAGGAMTGAASAGLVNPGDIGTGAAIGGALPVIGKAAGAVGKGIGSAAGITSAELKALFQKDSVRGAQELMKALDVTPDQLPAVIAQLRGAKTLVEGAAPTVAQALDAPQAAILQRIVAAGPGGEKLRVALAQQAEARMSALNSVAPVDPNGARTALEDTGRAIQRFAQAEREQAAQSVNGMYRDIDPALKSRVVLPAQQMEDAATTFMGPGAVGNNDMPNKFAAEARKLSAPPVQPRGSTLGETVKSIAPNGAARELKFPPVSAYRDVAVGPALVEPKTILPGRPLFRETNIAGLTDIMRVEHQPQFMPMFVANSRDIAIGQGNNSGIRVTFRPDSLSGAEHIKPGSGGVSGQEFRTDIVAPRAVQTIEMATSDIGQLSNLMRNRLSDFVRTDLAEGVTRFERKVGQERAATAALQAKGSPSMAPQQQPRGSPWDEVLRMRSSLNEQIQNAINNGDRQTSAALTAQKQTLDAAIEKQLPPEVLAKWQEANASRAAMGQRFDNGPQASIFSTRNGEPLKQSGEVARLFWGNRPGLAEDVQAFKRLVNDNQALLGQFKSMVTTEGAATAGADAALGQRFVNWTKNQLPGLREAFSPAEVQKLQNIADDVQRAIDASKRGMGPGSNTYQNAATALDAGLLDSPLVRAASSRIPFLNTFTEPGRAALAEQASKGKAVRLADLLTDANSAAAALEAMPRQTARQSVPLSALLRPDLVQFGYRAAPAIGADR